MVISTPRDLPDVPQLLQYGSAIGMLIDYAMQAAPLWHR